MRQARGAKSEGYVGYYNEHHLSCMHRLTDSGDHLALLVIDQHQVLGTVLSTLCLLSHWSFLFLWLKNVESPQLYSFSHILSVRKSCHPCHQNVPTFHSLRYYSPSSLTQIMAITSSLASLLPPFPYPSLFSTQQPQWSSENPNHTMSLPCSKPCYGSQFHFPSE